MGLLFLLGFGLIIYLLVRPSGNKPGNTVVSSTESQLEARNVEWAQFIANYHDIAKTKSEKQLVERMLGDIASKGLPAPIIGSMKQVAPSQVASPSSINSTDANNTFLPTVDYIESKKKTEIDNASLLLYFGAFLFVASVGLFIAFGGLPGTLRTFAVAFVAASMYGSGVWLFKTKPKLEQAGLAFAGIGLATAPFVGLALYNFVFNETSGSLVWFMTSIACIGLYAHALIVLKKPLLNYVLLFTMLSLVESGVSIIEAPIYYFGWGMALTGILFAFVSHSKKVSSDLGDSASQTAQLFMPLSAAASVIMIDSQGTLQLGVSLVLAALYYLLEYMSGRSEHRVANAVAAQVFGSVGLSALAYSMDSSFSAAAVTLLLINSFVIAGIIAFGKKGEISNNATSIAVSFSLLSILLSIDSATLLATAILITCVQSLVVWLASRRDEAYAIAVFLWMALPLVVGQLVLEPALIALSQTMLLLSSLVLQWMVVFAWRKHASESWKLMARSLYILSSFLTVGASVFSSSGLVLSVCAAVAISIILLAEHDKMSHWASFAGGFMIVPIIFHDNAGWLLVNTLIALAVNISVALRYRQEFSRWLSTGLWLVLPVAIGQNVIDWNEAHYVVMYVIVIAVLIFSRAVARGVLFASSKVAVASYARSASYSYVVGYVAAATIALLMSLTSPDSAVITTVLLLIFIILAWLLAAKIEKQTDLYVLIPVFVQAALLSAMRPAINTAEMNVYLALSTFIAAVSYVAAVQSSTKSKARTVALRDSSLIMAAITPLAVIVTEQTEFMMPVGLFVLTILLYHRLRETDQANKELIAGIGLLSVWWSMWYLGVTNLQAYTHVLAALFAGYAYWRHIRNDTATSDQYLYAMLGTATVPLALQALGGTAGDLYGWWLLLEQVAFMLLGMVIGKSFVTRWGLYVAVAAVLYQLRGLGWAALSLLALFLIALAVYRLQKQDQQK